MYANVTDVDDKNYPNELTLTAKSIETLTQRMILAMCENTQRLGLETPTHEPYATAYVETDGKDD